jgi:hypothetical protein
MEANFSTPLSISKRKKGVEELELVWGYFRRPFSLRYF